MLETYTFSFKYTGARGDVNSRLESLSLDPVGCVADMGSAHSARIGLEMIVRRLITLSTFLPILPSKYSLAKQKGHSMTNWKFRQKKPGRSSVLYRPLSV